MTIEAQPEKELMSEQECAAFLGRSALWLRRRRDNADGPPHYRLSRKVIIYKRADVLEWLKGFEVTA